MADNFSSHGIGLDSPANYSANITPDDNTELAHRPRFIRVAVGGTLVYVDSAGAAVTMTVYDGEWLYIRPIIIKATGTSATGITAHW